MNYNSLKSDIAAVVRQNGNQEITGENLQGVLSEMIDNSVGTGYLYKGIATPETQGGTPDQNVFYLAGAGTYGNFGGTIIPQGSFGVFKYNGAWSYDVLNIKKVDKNDCNKGYYNTSAYPQGSQYIRPLVTANNIYACQCFLLRAGSSMSIYGRNDGTTSRLYVVCDATNGNIYEKAEANADSRSTPRTLSYNFDALVYVTASTSYKFEIYFSNEVEIVTSKNVSFYAFVIGTPTLDRETNTFTLPNGTQVLGNDRIITLANDYSVEKTSDYESNLIVLGEDELYLLPPNGKYNIPKGDIPIALLRWQNGICDANFFTYLLDGEKVYFKPTTNVAVLEDAVQKMTGVYASDFSQGYYYNLEGCVEDTSIDDYIGRTMQHEPTFLYIEGGTYWAYKFTAKKGSSVIIRGRGGSGTSRLYMGVENATNRIVYLASAGADTTQQPTQIEITNDTTFYVTFRNATDSLQNIFHIDENENVVPKIFNAPLNLKKSELRILDIGNSYTLDATHYLSQIIRETGARVTDIALVRCYRASGSFKTWVDCYNDEDTEDYQITQPVGTGNLQVTITGAHAAGNGTLFRNVLKDNSFDLVIIHQASTYSTDYDSWESSSEAGYLQELIRIIKENQPQATLGTYLIHSQFSGYSGNTEHSTLKRWELIANAVKQMQSNYGIDIVIPYGTAIENLRASSLNTKDAQGVSTVYDFCNDGAHLASGLGDYVASLCYFFMIYGARYGKNIVGLQQTITVPSSERTSALYPSAVIDVTAQNAIIAQKAAFLACCNIYQCINPDNVVLPTATGNGASPENVRKKYEVVVVDASTTELYAEPWTFYKTAVTNQLDIYLQHNNEPYLQTLSVLLKTGNAPVINIYSGVSSEIRYRKSSSGAISRNGMYLINASWDGSEWVVEWDEYTIG